MSQQNKDLLRDFAEEFLNQGNEDAADRFLTDDYVYHEPSGNDLVGRDATREHTAAFRAAFPDVRFDIEDVVAEGDRVCVRWVVTGTHRGPFRGIAPTGRKVQMAGMTITRVASGKLAEDWVIWDAPGLLGQIGAAPAE